ncbi:MAG: hypothetical protein EOO73_12875 [Myxococcales bacterium]|nr:MAG: hypothetical protein EOO73_12875 [Myxococcales bacterium]
MVGEKQSVPAPPAAPAIPAPPAAPAIPAPPAAPAMLGGFGVPVPPFGSTAPFPAFSSLRVPPLPPPATGSSPSARSVGAHAAATPSSMNPNPHPVFRCFILVPPLKSCRGGRPSIPQGPKAVKEPRAAP